MSSLKRQILFSYSHDELKELMSTNSAFSCLAYDGDFWFEKASKEFRVNRWYWSLTSPYLLAYDNYLTISFKNKVIKDSRRVFDRQVCLTQAAYLGDMEMVEHFLASLVQDNLEPNYAVAFSKAFSFGRLEVCRKLFPFVEGRATHILLEDACESGQFELVEMYFRIKKENALDFARREEFEFSMVLALSHSVSFYLQVEKLIKSCSPEKSLDIRTFFRLLARHDFCKRAQPEAIDFLREMGIEKEQENDIKQRASDAGNFTLCEKIGGEYSPPQTFPHQMFEDDNIATFENYLNNQPTITSWQLFHLFKCSLKNRSYSIAQFMFEKENVDNFSFITYHFVEYFKEAGIFGLAYKDLANQSPENWSSYFIKSGCFALLPICFPEGCSKENFNNLVESGKDVKFRDDMKAFLDKFCEEI